MSSNQRTRKARGVSARRGRMGYRQRPATIDPDAYDARVLLTPCPVCGAGSGDRCWRQGRSRGGAEPHTKAPHPERVEATSRNL